MPQRKRNIWPNEWEDALTLRRERRRIETVNSQLAAIGILQLQVRSVAGLEFKVHAFSLALTCTRAT